MSFFLSFFSVWPIFRSNAGIELRLDTEGRDRQLELDSLTTQLARLSKTTKNAQWVFL